MKFIKTCYGGYINPAQVKHFGVHYAERRGVEYVAVKADEVPIAFFDIEPVPDPVKNPKSRSETWDMNKRRARAEAINWLDKLIEKIGGAS